MNKISYSAPGKVILSGEHTVVYGKPAIVCAIDKRLTLTITPAKKTHYLDTIVPIIESIVIAFLKERNELIKQVSYIYEISSKIPIGRGLGSSAAYSAVFAAGLLELFTGREWSTTTINMCAYKIEQYFHKNCSGVDVSTSVIGGLIYYRKEFEFLKTISSLSIKIPKKMSDSLLLIDTGKPEESTAEMIQKVGTLFKTDIKKIEQLLVDIEKTTKKLVLSLMKEDTLLFKESIQKNEQYLEMMGVVSHSTSSFIKKMIPFGKGKVTGGGGYKSSSGYILFICDNREECEKELKNKNIPYSRFIPSYTGLKKEI